MALVVTGCCAWLRALPSPSVSLPMARWSPALRAKLLWLDGASWRSSSRTSPVHMGSYPVQKPGWRRFGTCAHGIVSRTEPWMEAVLEPVHMGSYPWSMLVSSIITDLCTFSWRPSSRRRCVLALSFCAFLNGGGMIVKTPGILDADRLAFSDGVSEVLCTMAHKLVAMKAVFCPPSWRPSSWRRCVLAFQFARS
jgi:hypothetical protein